MWFRSEGSPGKPCLLLLFFSSSWYMFTLFQYTRTFFSVADNSLCAYTRKRSTHTHAQIQIQIALVLVARTSWCHSNVPYFRFWLFCVKLNFGSFYFFRSQSLHHGAVKHFNLLLAMTKLKCVWRLKKNRSINVNLVMIFSFHLIYLIFFHVGYTLLTNESIVVVVVE